MTEVQTKLTELFTFLREVVRKRFPTKTRLEQSDRHFFLDSLPAHPAISLTRVDEEDESSYGEFLVIRRPEIPSCPRPPSEIANWLLSGWENEANAVAVQSEKFHSKDGKVTVEKFGDSTSRRTALNAWEVLRQNWVSAVRPAKAAMRAYVMAYEWYGCLQRQSEPMELFLGDGILECLTPSGSVRHPILLRRVSLEFRPEANPPEFVFQRTDKAPELYLDLLYQIEGADIGQIGKCKSELASLEVEPLGGEDTDGFLRRLVQGVFADRGDFLGDGDPINPDRVGVSREPVLFLSRKPEGAVGVFDAILEDVPQNTDFSEALLNLIGIREEGRASREDHGPSFPANEDPEIYLCKEANREQLEVAKRLAHHGCVVVQGPPGTGKTHTIANLLGHLLANGKRVLVTAHTSKALRVLRNKVVKSLQALCLSVLQKDKKSQEELEAAVTEIQSRISQDPVILERRAEQLRLERSKVISEIRRVREKMLQARLDEVRPINFGDRSMKPIEAAEFVRSRQEVDGWIPGEIAEGLEFPLSAGEVLKLYQTNLTLTSDDERQLAASRPNLSLLPLPNEFETLVREHGDLRALDLEHGEEFWEREHDSDDIAPFDQMFREAQKTIGFLSGLQRWQLEAIQAGRDGEVARVVWESLITLIGESWLEIQQCRPMVIELGPEILDGRDPEQLQPILRRIINHLEAGESFGLLTKLTKADCHALMAQIRINGRPASPKEVRHFHAAEAWLRIQLARQNLRQRWERMITALQGPGVEELTEEPENVCRGFANQIRSCLEWHQTTWSVLESRFVQLGFLWTAYLDKVAPETGSNADLRCLQKALNTDLERVLQVRAARIRLRQLNQKLYGWTARIPNLHGAGLMAVESMRRALLALDPAAYSLAHQELDRLARLEEDFETRKSLLRRLGSTAAQWAEEIRNRRSNHGGANPPGDVLAAWLWRQIFDELERRAAVSLPALQERIDELNRRLVGSDGQPGLTAELVDNAAWAHLIRNTSLTQKQALGAYVKLRSKMSKSGTGVRDPQLRIGAREAMKEAVAAVPVWIMPLAEVAETFDPQGDRFDVVIIDEASQCDATALFALYLGKQCVVVGDDEQVSPVAVGQLADEVSRLINLHLQRIPRRELYDSTTSIYDLAQVFFAGKSIRLREHFRCAPDIISFSNSLSYGGSILPLREPAAITLKPHVIPVRVPSPEAQSDKINATEAEWIASLICAAVKHPAYQVGSSGSPVTFGVVSLLGGDQSLAIDRLLLTHLSATEYVRRQVLCGDAADFQGDERDVILISLVDTPSGGGPLHLRGDGPKAMFKKRYNVAASRARDQLWVVHSLDPQVDLKSDDIRRRLIEHAHDPKAWERNVQTKLKKAESIFEQRVIRHLTNSGYETIPQYPVGAYRIDIVVTGGGHRLAVECDGEQYHGPEQLQDDLERQAILERLGWRFVRIRGNIFFRDPDRAMKPVYQRLEELEIPREQLKTTLDKATSEDQAVGEIHRMAAEIRKTWIG